MVDYSELRNYLEAQAELGEDEVFFEEPWSLALLKKKTAPAMQSAPVLQRQPAQPQRVQMQRSFAEAPKQPSASRVQILSGGSGGRSDALDLSALATRSESTPVEFLSSTTLQGFYDAVAKHSIYQGANVVGVEGAQNPEVLLVFDAPQPDDKNPSLMASNVGQMVFRLFAALSVPAGKCALTYVYKREAQRMPSVMLDVTLRQMLEKEVSLLKPQKIVVFGELAMRQMFGRDKSLRAFGGTVANFASVPTVAIHDARQMLTNVALKKETWSVFLPKSGLFK